MGRRRVLLTALAVLGAVLVMTWYGRLVRCQAELAAWAQLRAAFVSHDPAMLVTAREAPRGAELFEATGITRTEAAVARYCDAPAWEWWR